MPAMPVVASSTLTGAVRHAVTHSESASPCARHLAPGITRQKLVAVSRCLPTDSLQPRHALFPSTADLNVEGKVLQTPGRYPTPPPKTPNLCNPWTSARLQSNGQSPQVRRCCPTAPQLAPFSETIGPSNSDFSDVGGPTKTRSFGLKKPKTSTLQQPSLLTVAISSNGFHSSEVSLVMYHEERLHEVRARKNIAQN